MSRMRSQVMTMICILVIIFLFRKVYCFLFLMGAFPPLWFTIWVMLGTQKLSQSFLQQYNIVSCNWNTPPLAWSHSGTTFITMNHNMLSQQF